MKLLRSLIPAALILAPLPALAAQIVLFEDGRSMRVEAVIRGTDMTTLDLAGGGRLAVPSTRISGWIDANDREGKGDEPRVPPPDADAPWRDLAGEFADLIGAAARRNDLDPALLASVAQVESAFDPRAVSPKGARGLLQLMPGTAERFGVGDSFDPIENVEGGAQYLRWLLERFEGRLDLALAGYNAGERAVERHEGIPPYPETQDYVGKVMAWAEELAGSEP